MTYEISPVPPTPRPSSGGHGARGAGIVAACLVLFVGAIAFAAVSAPRTAVGANPSASATVRAAAPSAAAGDRGPSLGGKAFRSGAAFGTITIASISGTKIGLRTADGWTRTIDVGAGTKIFLGKEAATLGDLKVGDDVRMRQKRNADGTFSIVSLTVPAAQAGGKVTAVSATTITITRRGGGTTTLTVNASTVYRQGGADASKADVKIGSTITAQGKPGSITAFTATVVRISLSRLSGEVTAKTANTVTVKQRDGTSVVVHVDADTRFLVRGLKGAKATLADVAVGNRLVATGIRRADGSLDAVAIGASTPKAPRATKPASPAPSAANG